MSSADRYRDDPFASTTSGFGSVGGGKGSYAPTSTSPEGAAAKDEMVMMPHLGQDWDDKEAQRDKRWEGKVGRQTLGLKTKGARARRGANSWMRGERKCWGWLGWRQGVFLIFASLVGCILR